MRSEITNVRTSRSAAARESASRKTLISSIGSNSTSSSYLTASSPSLEVVGDLVRIRDSFGPQHECVLQCRNVEVAATCGTVGDLRARDGPRPDRKDRRSMPRQGPK